MNKNEFLPIILGTDANAYGMAKSFYDEYKIKPLILGKKRLYQTKFSKIVKVLVFEDFDKQQSFIANIIPIAKKLKEKYKNLILVSCGDGYTELIVNNKEILEQYFHVPYINKDLKEQLEDKEDFYKTCEKYGLDFPKTKVLTKENYNISNIEFEFPVVLKASNSIEYLHSVIKNKKKAYILKDMNELKQTLKNIYNSSYKSNMILQEYVPGDDSAMWVLNSYSNKNGKVKMMCLGHTILEDYYPNDIGNYNAIISSYNKEIYDKMKKFLEEINYIGFSNFDMKYDYRDGKYKLFEINIRQGRSSYVVTGSGNNMAKYLVEDYIYNKDNEVVYNENEWLWLGVFKKTLLKYINEEYKEQVMKLLKEKAYGYTLFNKKDMNPFRLAIVYKLYDIQRKNYIKYFERK